MITGASPIGLMAIAVARHAGARHVVVADVNDYRLALARKIDYPASSRRALTLNLCAGCPLCVRR